MSRGEHLVREDVLRNRGFTDREVESLPFFIDYKSVKFEKETVVECVDGKEKKRTVKTRVEGRPMLSRYPTREAALPWLAKLGERGWVVLDQNVITEEEAA